MSHGVFVTDTHTDIAKMTVCAPLRAGLRENEVSAAGIKTVASGARCSKCRVYATPIPNLSLGHSTADAGSAVDSSSVNPYAFGALIAPHGAPHDASMEISLATLCNAYVAFAAMLHCIIVERVGDWTAPLGNDIRQADIARDAELPVILVVVIRLGCINHARLSQRAIVGNSCVLARWIGSVKEPSVVSKPISKTYSNAFRHRRFGVLPHAAERPQQCAPHVNDAGARL